MKATDLGLGLLYFVPPLAAAALVPRGNGSPALAAALFTATLAYARLGAFVAGRRGRDEAAFGMALLPFLAWLALRAGGLEAQDLPAFLAACVLAAALLYAAEELFVPASRGFALVLAFLAGSAGAGFLLARAPALAVAPASALGLVAIGFMLARRRR